MDETDPGLLAEVPDAPIATEAGERLKRKVYERELRKLQVELCHMQAWVRATGARIIVVFEGRDAAGKGGTIKAITEAGQPPGVPGRGPARALGPGEEPALPPALPRAFPGRRRGRDLRPLLV